MGFRRTFVGNAETTVLPSAPTTTSMSTPSRVPRTTVRPRKLGARAEAGSFATSLIASMVFSSDQTEGNSLFPGVPRPGPWPPPPLPSPSRMYLRRSSVRVASPGFARLGVGRLIPRVPYQEATTVSRLSRAAPASVPWPNPHPGPLPQAGEGEGSKQAKENPLPLAGEGRVSALLTLSTDHRSPITDHPC